MKNEEECNQLGAAVQDRFGVAAPYAHHTVQELRWKRPNRNGTAMIWKERYSLSEVLFFTAYGVFLVVSVLAFSFFAKQVNGIPHILLVLVCLGLLALKEAETSRYSRAELLGLALCTLLFVIVLRVGRDVDEICMAFQIFYVFAARDISFERISRFTIAVTGATCVFVVGCSLLDVIPNVVLLQEQVGLERFRQCLGFRYALYLPGLYTNLVALWVCLKRERISLWSVALLLVLNRWIYNSTCSRTAYVIVMVLLAAALVLRFLPQLPEQLHALFVALIFAYPIGAAVSLTVTDSYDRSSTLMSLLDSIFNNRLRLGKNSMTTYGLTLFGENIHWVGFGLDMNGRQIPGAYNYVDCLYLQLLQHYGLIFFLIYIALMMATMYRCYQQREYYLLIVMTVAAAQCMLDDLSQYLPFNTFWFVTGAVLLGKERPRESARLVSRIRPRIRLQW